MQFRHPYDLGGFFYSLNNLISQVSIFVCGYLYHRYAEEDEKKIPASALFSGLVLLLATWICGFSIFYYTIKPEYRHTFTDTTSGAQYTINLFTSGDEKQMWQIFTCNHRQWVSIAEDVRRWTFANWLIWEQTKPEWFTEDFISFVPDDFIPKNLDPNRRRSSVMGSLAPRNLGQVQPFDLPGSLDGP